MNGFFEQIRQHQLQWRGEPMLLPVFCYDNSTLSAIFTASTKKVRSLIPVPEAKLTELFPGRCLVAINCFEYRQTDIGPYNEVAISFLMSKKGWQIPGLTALVQLLRRRLTAYVWQLPVTTEIAWAGGREIYGYPKFLANVQFTTETGRYRCSVEEEGRPVLSIEGPVVRGKAQTQLQFVTYSMKDGIPLVANVIQRPLEAAIKLLPRDVTITLGPEHEVGRVLANLNISKRAVAYYYSPKNEAILFAARNLIDS